QTAALILLLSSGVGLAANLVRTKGKLEWMAAPKTPELGPKILKQEAVGPGGREAREKVTPVTSEPAAEAAHYVTLDEVMQHLAAGDAKFVDARNGDQYAAGHIKGAMNVPSSAAYDSMPQVQQFIGSPELVIVYCGGGHCEASHD